MSDASNPGVRCLPPATTSRARHAAHDAAVAQQRRALYRVALRLTRDAQDAEDLVQDALERGLRRGRALVPDANLRAWLLTVVHNLFIDDCRRRRRCPEVCYVEPDAELRAPVPTPEPTWSAVTSSQLDRAIAGLAPAYREVFELHARAGLGYAAIAARVGIAPPTVGSRLCRARYRLRQMLSGPHAAP